MTSPDTSCFIFVVKTDNYAGNYEREMCAFLTGVMGDCEVGDVSAGLYALKYPGDNPWQEKLLQVSDEHGCHRPVSIWNNCQDVAIFLEDKPTPEDVQFLRKRASLFVLDPRISDSGDDSKPRIAITGFELIEYKVEFTETPLEIWPPMDVLEATE